MYHRMGSIPSGTLVPGHYVTANAFERHLRLLKRLGLPTTKLGSGLQPGTSIITFDDGYQSFVDLAAPILRASGDTATVFLVTGLMGQSNDWDAKRGDVVEPLMTWESARQLATEGIEFGTHTRTHDRLTESSEDELHQEVRGSFEDFAAEMGRDPEWFCYPYGAEDERVATAVKQAGYRGACSTRKGINTPGTPPFLLNRINVRSSTTIFRFWHKVWRASRPL
jgi:peptidoglycan/xylan/chitin deacetylase (PgdA/CDA1 family)